MIRQTTATARADREKIVEEVQALRKDKAPIQNALRAITAREESLRNLEEMNELIANVKTGEVTYAVRDTEIKGVEIKKDHWMGMAT